MADDTTSPGSELNWPAFYAALVRIAPWAMTGLPDGGREYIQTCGLASDAFWSDDLQDTAIELWEQSPTGAVNEVMEIYCENVRRAYCEMPLAMVEEWISLPSSEANFTRERCINCIDFKITAPTLDFLLAAGHESVTSIEPHADVAPRIVARVDSVGLNGSPVGQPSAFIPIQSNRVSLVPPAGSGLR